ncbi:unnamed protein product, partial [Cyprideis torosa]
MFSEILNGALEREVSDASANVNDPSVKFLKPKMRLGMIPCGSTDALVYATNGTSDVVTAAIHIILGDRLPVDVCAIHSRRGFERGAVICIATGFLGSMLAYSEKLRCMGPERYSVAAVRAFLRHKKVAFSASLTPTDSSPVDESPCFTDCITCTNASIREVFRVESEPELSETPRPCPTVVKGSFLHITSAVSTAAYDMAPHGVSPYNHFGNGCMDVIFVKKTSRLNHLKFFYRILFKPGKQVRVSETCQDTVSQ